MALTSCPACDGEVSTSATKCPRCGHRIRKPKRGFFGKLFKWSFVLFNLLMVFWLFSYVGDVSEQYGATADEYGRAGTAIGGTIGVGILLFLWVLLDVILGMMVLFTRPRD